MANSTKISEYSTTAANNTSIDSIDIDENCAASGINNALRSVLKHQADAFTQGTPIALDQTNNRVGIGTVTPSGKLHLSESGAVNAAATIFSVDGTASTFGANLAKSSGTYTTPATNISGGAWEYRAANSANDHGDMLYLSAPDTNDSSSTPVERFRIDDNGRIGINNASPSYLIDALGTGTGDNADAVMRIKAQGTGDSDVNLILDAADTGESIVSFYNDGNSEANIEWNSTNAEFNIRTQSGTDGDIDISRTMFWRPVSLLAANLAFKTQVRLVI